jgi:heat shock protein HtpX
VTLQEQIRANRWRTVLLFVLFLAVILVVGLAVSIRFGWDSLIVVAIVGIVYGVFSYFASGSMVASMTGAHPVTKEQAPDLVRVVENVAIAAGLSRTPPVYIVDDPAPNAFAAGRNLEHAYVCVTSGLLQLMDKRELEGVIAHEMGHIRNRDVRLMTLATVMVGVIALLADLLIRMTIWGGAGNRGRRDNQNPIFAILAIVALVLAPIAATLIQLALSRRREYLADEASAEITGDPEGLALALRKLDQDPQELRHLNRATAHLYIEAPLNKANGLGGAMSGLFDTHPSLQSRIARLEQAGGFTLPPA